MAPTHHVGYSPLRRHVPPAQDLAAPATEIEDEDEELWEFTWYVEGLTLGFPMSMTDTHRHWQMNTICIELAHRQTLFAAY